MHFEFESICLSCFFFFKVVNEDRDCYVSFLHLLPAICLNLSNEQIYRCLMDTVDVGWSMKWLMRVDPIVWWIDRYQSLEVDLRRSRSILVLDYFALHWNLLNPPKVLQQLNENKRQINLHLDLIQIVEYLATI